MLPHQTDALQHVEKGENVLALWGRRTGKSTLARVALARYMRNTRILVILPTHRMVKNYMEYRSYPNIDVFCYHQLIGLDLEKYDLVIIDEFNPEFQKIAKFLTANVLYLATPYPNHYKHLYRLNWFGLPSDYDFQDWDYVSRHDVSQTDPEWTHEMKILHSDEMFESQILGKLIDEREEDYWQNKDTS